MNGIEVRHIRTTLGLNPQAFANLLGVHLTTVYRWEAAGPLEMRLEPLQSALLLRLRQKATDAKPEATGQRLIEALLVGGTLVGLAALLSDLIQPPPPPKRKRRKQ